jgi:hypothetical protein
MIPWPIVLEGEEVAAPLEWIMVEDMLDIEEVD